MKREINMMKKTNTEKSSHINAPANMKEEGSIITDPNGSYTGYVVNGDPFDKPIQDVDDL